MKYLLLVNIAKIKSDICGANCAEVSSSTSIQAPNTSRIKQRDSSDDFEARSIKLLRILHMYGFKRC